MVARRVPTVLAFGALALVAGACSGGGKSGAKATTTVDQSGVVKTGATTTVPLLDPGVTSNTVGGPRIACRVEVTGAVTASFISYDDKSAFSSDYYLSADEIREAAIPRGATTIPGRTTTAGVTAPVATPPPRPAGAAPLIGWLLLNCQGGDITLSFYSDPSSTTNDVPFRSGRYTINPGGAPANPKQLVASASFFADPTMLWQVDKGASLQFDQFDTRGASGSFSVPMKNVTTDGSPSTKTLRFQGSFAVTCKSGANCRP